MRYVKISIVGHEDIKAYENEDKKSDKHPDFKADGVAVWVNQGRDDRNGERQQGASRLLDIWPDDDKRHLGSSLREPAFAF